MAEGKAGVDCDGGCACGLAGKGACAGSSEGVLRVCVHADIAISPVAQYSGDHLESKGGLECGVKTAVASDAYRLEGVCDLTRWMSHCCWRSALLELSACN